MVCSKGMLRDMLTLEHPSYMLLPLPQQTRLSLLGIVALHLLKGYWHYIFSSNCRAQCNSFTRPDVQRANSVLLAAPMVAPPFIAQGLQGGTLLLPVNIAFSDAALPPDGQGTTTSS